MTTWMTRQMKTDLCGIGESPREIVELVEAGKTPCVMHTTNGREIRVEKAGFVVQPCNDNYWITVPSLKAALDAFNNPAKYRS